MNPLRKAANTNNIPTLSKILMMNPYPKFINDVDTAGRTALTIASERGNIESVQLLLNYDADSSIRTIKGMTALICAANRGHTECLNLLIRYGANLNIKDFHGGTALTYAAKFGNLECLKCLVMSGADMNAKDKWGMTPLMYACREGFYDCVEYLIEYGADIFLMDKTGKLASQYSSTAEITDLVESCEMSTPSTTPRTDTVQSSLPSSPRTNLSSSPPTTHMLSINTYVSTGSSRSQGSLSSSGLNSASASFYPSSTSPVGASSHMQQHFEASSCDSFSFKMRNNQSNSNVSMNSSKPVPPLYFRPNLSPQAQGYSSHQY